MLTSIKVPEPQLWLDRYGDELYRFALARVRTATAAEELVQETLLSALRALESFRGHATERTWLFVILKRKLIDHYRRQARSLEVPLPTQPSAGPTESLFFETHDGHWRREQYPAAWENTEDTLERQELQRVLELCQRKLPRQHEAVFVLRFLDELPAEEICQELHLTTANYWVIVHRAKLQLRRCLEVHGLGRSSRS